MPSRIAGKKSLAPAVAANWLIIMASAAGIAIDTTGVRAEDGSDIASNPGKWSVVIGGGGAYAPDYEGSDDYEFQPFPFASVVYDNFIFVEGASLGINLVNYEGFAAGPIARYGSGRDEDDNDALDGLGDVGDSIELGGFAKYQAGIWSAALTVTQDVGGGHEGMVAEMASGVALPLADNMSSSIEVSAGWADGTYMDSFFGVSPGQSRRSGNDRFAAGAGFKDVGIMLGLDYMISEAVGVSGRVQYKRLVGDAAESPIVEEGGSADQFFTGMFLTYRFR